MPASSAAAENVGHARVTSTEGTRPGSTFELPAGITTEPPNESLRVKLRSTSAFAALNVLCPDA